MMPATLKPEISEEQHRAAEAAIKRFKYEKPSQCDQKKVSVRLAQGELVRGMIQVAKEGGENNLHYHANVDGFWMVLSGKVRFYGPVDQLIAELGPREGLVIPRYARYWFENAGDEELEILLVQAFAQGRGQAQLRAHRCIAAKARTRRRRAAVLGRGAAGLMRSCGRCKRRGAGRGPAPFISALCPGYSAGTLVV